MKARMPMKRIVYTSPYVPAEFIAAHGFCPSRAVPCRPKRMAASGSLEGICPYALAFVNEVVGDTSAYAVVLTTTCDQMRRSADLIKRESDIPIFLMNVPATWQTAAPRRLYRSELERLGRFLVDLGGRAPSSKELTRVMMKREKLRIKLVIPAGKKGIAILGGPLPADERWFIDTIKRAGGQIVLDGTENGERTMPAPFNRKRIKADPMSELVHAYFETIPDVFQRPNTRLYEWLDRALLERDVKGIIVRYYVWCDLWHAEVQRIVERSKLPVLYIDTEGGNLSRERTLSRVQAFLEMLK